MNRRKFIKNVGIGAAGLSFLNWMEIEALTASYARTSLSMGGLTNFMIIDDCARLSVESGLVSEKVKKYISADISKPIPANMSRMGAMINAEIEEVVAEFILAEPEMNKARKNLESLPPTAKTKQIEEAENKLIASERKLAILLGWFMSAGIRKHIAPMYQEEELNNLNFPNELKIYHDMFLLRERSYLGNSANQNEIADLFNGILPRMICRTHTMTPDYDDGFEWTVRISNWRDENVTLMNKYAEAFVNPDKSKIKKYIIDNNFYDREDKLISCAVSSNKGKQVTKSKIKNAIDKNSPNSLYAKALKEGIQNLSLAEKYLNGQINQSELLFEIAK